MTSLPVQEEAREEPAAREVVESTDAASDRPAGRQDRLAIWLQFPRRVVFLLIAFGLAQGLIAALRRTLPRMLQRGADRGTELILERLPSTLLLLGVTLFVAFLLAMVCASIAVLVHSVERRTGPLGSILKAAGRLLAFGEAAAPIVFLALLLIYAFAMRLQWLPAAGMLDRTGGGRLGHLILPVLTLSLLPAVLTAQAAAREVTLPREGRGLRIWLGGLFKALGTLLGQIGGLLSAVVLVETIFVWPGIGRLTVEAIWRLDPSLLLSALSTYAILVLVGRLAAELFRWLERLVQVPILSPQPEPTRWRKRARTVWAGVALALLLVPLGVAAAGLAVGEDAATQPDPGARSAPPSAEHPWGTDMLGRDVRAGVLRGGAVVLGTTVLVAMITLIPSGLGGALTGFLASLRKPWSESLADLLLVPADVLLFIPVVPGAIALVVMAGGELGDLGMMPVVLAIAALLPPRVVRAYQGLWTAAPARRRGMVLGLAGPGVVLLGTLFAGLWLVAALDFLGLGAMPPVPTLGGMLATGMSRMVESPHVVLAPGLVLWACSFVFYVAVDALVGFSYTKEALARLNE